MPTRKPEKQDVDHDGRKEIRLVPRRQDGTYAPGPKGSRPKVGGGKRTRK